MLVASVVLGAGLACATAGEGPRPPMARSDQPTIPFVDAHNHIMPGLRPERVISVLDEVGVSKVVLMATGAPQRELERLNQLTLQAHEQHPDRVIPFVGLNSVRTLSRSLLDHAWPTWCVGGLPSSARGPS